MSELSVVREFRQEVNILRVKNPVLLDPSAADALTDELSDSFESGDQRLLIDIGAVSRMSSLFFRSFIIAGKKASANNAKMAFCNVSPLIRSGFEMMGLDSYFKIYETETQAVDAMSRGS